MLLEDGLGDGEAQTGPLLARVGAGAVVPVKDIGQIVRRDAGAVVLDLDPDALGALLRPEDEHAVRADVVHRIAQQIVQGALHHVRVRVNGQFFVRKLQLEGPVVLGTDGIIPLADLVAELAHIEVDLLALFCAARDLAQFHDAGHQRGQAVGFIDDDVHLLVTVGLVVAGDVPHRLGIALDEGQRGAQVVGDICQQVPLHLGCALDLPRHVVEVLGQVAQLVAAGRLDMDRVVPVCHLTGRTGELPQRFGEPLAEQPCRAHREREDERCRYGQHRAQHLARLGDVHQGRADQHGIGPIVGHPPHDQLIGRRRLGSRQHPGKAADFAAVLPDLTGRGIGQIIVQRVGKRFLVQTAIGKILVLFNGAQRRIGDVHAEAAQVAAGIDRAAQRGKEIVVRDLDAAERPI